MVFSRQKIENTIGIWVEKGKKIVDSVKIPVGRKIRQSIIIEQRRLARKAALEARQRG